MLINIEIEKDGKFQADANIESIKVDANMNYEKKENTLIVSANSAVPFVVVGYRIKGNKQGD